MKYVYSLCTVVDFILRGSTEEKKEKKAVLIHRHLGASRNMFKTEKFRIKHCWNEIPVRKEYG